MTGLAGSKVLSLLMAVPLLLGACGDGGGQRDIITSRREAMERGLGEDAIGTDGSSIRDAFTGGEDEGTGQSLRVNKHMWRAALDTLAFLPLASTDPFSGVIVTDWGSVDGATAERFKVTVFIANERLNTETLRVAVFREVQGKNGWVSAPVQPEVPRKIEDAILTRARQIRIAEVETRRG